MSNVISTIDPRGTTTSYAYNVRNWQTQQIEAYGTALQRATTTSFDLVGNVLNVTDPNGVTASFGYDADNRQTVRVDAFGVSGLQRATTTAYDPVGKHLVGDESGFGGDELCVRSRQPPDPDDRGLWLGDCADHYHEL